MKLNPGTTVRISPASPLFPAFHVKVSPDGNAIVTGGGVGYWWSQSWLGYRSAFHIDETTGDPLYTRWDFEEDGTAKLWACVPCHVVFEATWAYVA